MNLALDTKRDIGWIYYSRKALINTSHRNGRAVARTTATSKIERFTTTVND